MVTYTRNTSGYTLNAIQQAALAQTYATLQMNLFKNPAMSGAGIPLYQQLFSDLLAPGADIGTVDWLLGAQGVNGNNTFAGMFIQDYTIDQYTLRNGSASSADVPNLVATASNDIAVNLYKDLVANNFVAPDISSIAVIDAGAIASNVFSQGGSPNYAPWAGALLFPWLGDSEIYNQWILN